jgi:hypothetical protein
LVFDGGQKSAKKFEQKEAKVTKEPTGVAFRDVRQQHNVGRTREQKATRFPSSVNDNLIAGKSKAKSTARKTNVVLWESKLQTCGGNFPPQVSQRR